MIDFIPLSATLEAIEKDLPDSHLFQFRLSQPLLIAPGQFVELSLPGIGAFPLSIVTWPNHDLLQLCIRRVGRVTSALYRMPIGTSVGIRGPFGHGFPLENFVGRNVLLLAGGLGIVPLRSLLHWLIAHRHDIGEITLLYGSSNVGRILFRPELERLAATGLIHLALSVEEPFDAGSISCHLGTVADLLVDLDHHPATTVAAVCGPPTLYRHLLEKLATVGISADRIYASLERRMKCGVGQCCHCVTAGTFICCQGPVFSLQELRMMPGAI